MSQTPESGDSGDEGNHSKLSRAVLELLSIFLFDGAAFDKAVGEVAGLHQKDVRARGDTAVHDKGGFGDGHPGKGRGKKGVETVENRDEVLGFGRVAGIDPAGDGTARSVDHERDADERTVASLLLGVHPPGQAIAPADPLEGSIAHVLEEHRLGGPGQRLAVFDKLPFDNLFDAPETVGDGVKGILADDLDVAADHLRQARPGGEVSHRWVERSLPGATRRPMTIAHARRSSRRENPTDSRLSSMPNCSQAI